MGVDVRLGTKVTDVDATGITVTEPDGSSTRIEALTKVWAAGVQASPLGRQLAEQSGRRASTVRAGCWCCPTSPCPATPRSSSSAT